jgi:phosphatidylserine/phosphatidylglycerophosphate/cardiolipin synthase-like enzyme
MKKIFFTFLIALCVSAVSAQISIIEARSKDEGTTVTISGITLNGSEMGIIRYIQDETAGIAIYSSLLEDIERGDKIMVTGVLKNYNNLLEIDPVTAITIMSSNNNLPSPSVLLPSQLTEEYESEVIEIQDVVFSNSGSTFAGNSSYIFSTNGESASIYVKAGSDLEGQLIPSGELKLIGICSQYSYNDPETGYQMLLRDMEDIQNNSSIFLTSPVNVDLFTSSKIQYSWSTNIEGNSFLQYGNTQDLELATTFVANNSSFHQISLTTLQPSELIYARAFVTDGIDTAYSPIIAQTSISLSSGTMKVYFNTETEDTASSEDLAITLDQAIDDTLIQYINRAELSIDLAIYNINNTGLSNITEALNNAFSRGLDIRIVHDGSTACLGLETLNESIPTIASPITDEYGIMHNKFIIIDAEAENPNQPIVWTGSTNLTNDNVNLDANNVIIIQDKSLAIAYKLEFEEMWGSNAQTPDLSNSKFGFEKSDNTPHKFNIGGNFVELYFSPSDQTNSYLIDAINSADEDLSIETMLITRSDIGYAIQNANDRNVATNVITNAEVDNSTFVNELLREELKVHFTYDNISSGVLHNKFLIVDQSSSISDPLVLTGSHNWSNAANNTNDENTLVIHNQTIANLYYQQFVYRFIENEGSFIEINDPPVANNDTVNLIINGSATIGVLENDEYISNVTMEIFENASNGKSEIPFTNPNKINYVPNTDYLGNDTIKYKLSYSADPDLFDIGLVILKITKGEAISDSKIPTFSIFPNPNSGEFTLDFSNKYESTSVSIFDLSGRVVYNTKLPEGVLTHSISLNNEVKKGCYILQVSNSESTFSKKVIIE